MAASAAQYSAYGNGLDSRSLASLFSKPFVSWEDLTDLCDNGTLTISSPVQQQEPNCHFSSIEEALVKLSLARFVEQKWEEKMFQELCKGDFDAAFFLLGPNTAIACVKRKDPTIFIDQNAVWDEHMNIVLKFEDEIENSWSDPYDSDDTYSTIRVTGHVVSNRTSIDCEIVVLLNWFPTQLFKFATSLHQPANFIRLSELSIEVNDNPAKSQVQALNAFFSREKPDFAKWWPMLLAETGSKTHRVNFLQQAGWTKPGFDEVLGKITEGMRAVGKPLNQEQQKILSNAPFSRAGFKLIRGPPGCGKTTLIAMLAQLYLGAPGLGVMVLAGSNGSTDRSYETLDKWMRKDQCLDGHLWPLRVHKQYIEYKHFMSVLDTLGTKSRLEAGERNAAQIIVEADELPQRIFYERQRHAEELKHMSNADSGIAAAILEAMRIGKLPGAPSSGKSARHSMHDYHRVEAESGLSKLMMYRGRRVKGLPMRLKSEDKDEIKTAFMDVARYIVGTKRLIATTVGNATSRVLQDCVFRDTQHVVVIMDEAGLATDADLIHILAKLFTSERVESEFNGKNPIVTVVLVGDHKQGAPIVKSDTAKANTFGPQLAMSPFVRFASTSFPLESLWEQHRMVEILCKLPSSRCYDGMLRTSVGALSRRMTLQQREILVGLFGADFSRVKCRPDEQRSYAEDQHLRHWLLDVHGGCAQIDRALRNSRFNIANIEITLNFFKVLIRTGFVRPSEICILTFYNAQRQRYIDGVYAMEKELGLTTGELHNVVHTSDSFQGREEKCVILDLVVTKYFGENTLGHAGDEKKANVAFTRARDFLFIVGNSTILNSRFLREKGGRVEFILESMMGLLARNAVKRCHVKKPLESELTGRFGELCISGKAPNGIDRSGMN